MRKYKEATANTKVGAVRSVSGHALICDNRHLGTAHRRTSFG
jgi:hypothetical protein